jgi:hypothetical protein
MKHRTLALLALGFVLSALAVTTPPTHAEESWQPYDQTSGTYHLVPSNQAPKGALPQTTVYDNPPGYNPALAKQSNKPKVPWWKFWHKETPPPPVEKHTDVGERKLPALPYALLRVGAPLTLRQSGTTLPTGFYMVQPEREASPTGAQPAFAESQPNNVAEPKPMLTLAVKRAGQALAMVEVSLKTTTANQPVQAMTARQVTKQPLAVAQETDPLRQASLVRDPVTGGWVLRYQLQAWVYESQPL